MNSALVGPVRNYIPVSLFQVPASPNYSLVLYYAADRPVKENSLLGQFVNGTDMFRDSRLKLIPSIKEVTEAVLRCSYVCTFLLLSF